MRPQRRATQVQMRPPVTPRGPDETPAGRSLFSPFTDVLLVLAVPAGILVLDHQWMFPGAQRDPWIYLGYFKAAPEWIKAFPGAYFGTRLSVILPGLFLHSLLPTLAAQLSLHLALAWLALLSFYGVASALFGRPPALLATICLGCQPFFLFSVGENYVDGFGIAYFLASLLAATAAARGRWKPGLLAAGALGAAIVTANLYYVIYLPVVAVHFIVLNRTASRRPLLRSFAWATAAASGAFLAFGIVSKIMGGRFLYLIPSTAFATTFIKSANPFWIPPATWLRHATWLVFPAMVLLGALATVISLRMHPRKEPTGLLLYTQVLFIGFPAVMFASFPLSPTVVFQQWYYASLMLPLAALAIAGQLSLARDRHPRRSIHFAWVAGVVLVASFAIRTPKSLLSHHGPTVLVPLLAFLPAIAVVISRTTGTAARLVFVLSLAASSIVARDLFPQSGDFDRFGGDRAQIFLQVDRSVSAYRSFDRSGELFFWFDEAEEKGVLFDMIAATSLSGWRIVTMGFPLFVPGGLTANGTPVTPGMKIVVLSARETAWPEAEQAIRSLSLRARKLHEDLIEGAAGPFRMIFLEVLAPRSQQAPAPA